MTPKQKAKQLFEQMYKNLYSDGVYDAKQCALLCVNEQLELLNQLDETLKVKWQIIHLKEVKDELHRI